MISGIYPARNLLLQLLFSGCAFCLPLRAFADSSAALVPGEDAFAPLIADLREPQFSIQLGKYDMQERGFNAAAVSFGDNLPLYDFFWEEHSKLQFCIDGGVFSLFDLDTDSNDLRNTDFVLGFSLAYRVDEFSTRFRLSHFSSHLGDEYVMAHPDAERDNPSYEDAEIVVSYDLAGFRPYAAFGGIIRSTDSTKRLHFQGGLEYHRLLVGSYLGLVLAADLQTTQEQYWGLTQSYFAGLGLYGKEGRHVRAGAQFVHGFAPEGQFSEEKLHYWTFAFFFSP